MTGFARVAGGDAQFEWTWEARSVNGRGLDVRCRVPAGFDELEVEARARVAKRFARGNLALTLAVTRKSAASRLNVNRELLMQLVTLARELREQADAAPPRIDGLLSIRGVIETNDAEEVDEAHRAARNGALLAALDAALVQLAAAREAEGEALLATLRGHIDEVEALVRRARSSAAASPDAARERLQKQLSELLGGQAVVPPERLAQEVALLATRSDVREELDRLAAHIGQARALLAEGTAIGRRLEFLAQEFNREANTLCSKSSDIELTRIGLSLKASIDRLREQSANIE